MTVRTNSDIRRGLQAGEASVSAALSFSASNDSIKGERESFRANAENNGCAIAVPIRRYAKSSCIHVRVLVYICMYVYV